MSQKINIGGRAFLPVGEITTLEHELHFGALLAQAGVKDTLVQSGEALEAYELRVIERLLKTRLLLPMVACLIVPDSALRMTPRRGLAAVLERFGILPRRPRGCGWTPEIAAQTEAFLGALEEKRDKDQVHTLILEQLLPFWTRELSSWAASLRSSAAAVAAGLRAPSTSAIPSATGAG